MNRSLVIEVLILDFRHFSLPAFWKWSGQGVAKVLLSTFESLWEYVLATLFAAILDFDTFVEDLFM